MSDYTGHVEPRGATASRTISTAGGDVEIRKLSVGPMDNNCYVLRHVDTNQALVVDAANDAARIIDEVRGLDVGTIVTTHGHPDHWQALAAVRIATGSAALLHPADADMAPWNADVPIADGDVITIGGVEVKLVHAPGHTPGSTCLLVDQHLFTGDTLFPGGPGRVTNPHDFATIMASLRERLFVLPDETRIHPGHGDDTTLGRERPSLDEWEARGW